MKTVDVDRAMARGAPREIGRALHRRLIVVYLAASVAATGSGALWARRKWSVVDAAASGRYGQ